MRKAWYTLVTSKKTTTVTSPKVMDAKDPCVFSVFGETMAPVSSSTMKCTDHFESNHIVPSILCFTRHWHTYPSMLIAKFCQTSSCFTLEDTPSVMSLVKGCRNTSWDLWPGQQAQEPCSQGWWHQRACGLHKQRTSLKKNDESQKYPRWAFNLGCSPRFSAQNQIQKPGGLRYKQKK